MIRKTITENEAEQRFDKYLSKLLKEAPKSFLYKMLRKKNITLNGKKATGNEKLSSGDEVQLFLSEETYTKFHGSSSVKTVSVPLDILYEDKDILLINKPFGMLSQGMGDGTPSLNDYVLGYLLKKGELTETDLQTFRPSICNRLDRNTTGIVAAGKSLTGLQELSKAFHDRTVHKDYLTVVEGTLTEKKSIQGYLIKDEKENKVRIYEEERPGSSLIETVYTPLGTNGSRTLLMVRLVTGKTHQIRAHLSFIGHPILGDLKYGKRNRTMKSFSEGRAQLLHAWRLSFPEDMGRLQHLNQKTFYAKPPDTFNHILQEEGLLKYLPKITETEEKE